jgi:hypothetical protein
LSHAIGLWWGPEGQVRGTPHPTQLASGDVSGKMALKILVPSRRFNESDSKVCWEGKMLPAD